MTGQNCHTALYSSAQRNDYGKCGRLRLSHTTSATVGTFTCARLRVTATSLSRAAETVPTACHTARSQCIPTGPCLLYKETQAVEKGSALHRPFPVFLEPWGRAAGGLKRHAPEGSDVMHSGGRVSEGNPKCQNSVPLVRFYFHELIITLGPEGLS